MPYNEYSLCEAWQSVRKLVLVEFMLKGRHMGLPKAIGGALLLLGQELMERMDRESSGRVTDH